MSDTEDQLKRMVMTFRVSELQMLLGYAGKNKTGRKNELQSRALDIVRLRNPSIHQKIRELYKTIQLEMMSFGDRSQSAGTTAPGGILPNQRVPSGLNTMSTGYSQSGNVGGNMGVTVNSSGYSSRSSSAQVGQVPTMSGGVGYSSIQPSHNNSYPISPDVRLKKLPFYDILGELLKPSTLVPPGSGRYQEGTFTFSLTPQQANKIAHSRDLRPGKQDYTVQVQMRFCLLETTCEQEDNFPPNITVKINDKMCPLPSPIPTNKAGVEPKRPSRPVNVTSLCRISPTVTNRIMVTWSSDYGRCYVISVYLVQKLTSEDLLQRLKSKGPRLADFTRSLIKQKLREDGECEIATTSLRCSLLCPLGKMRMMLPCRAETCNHLQCFDASLFLQMNERKPTWTCPVCDKPALYDNLVIDGYFQEVLQENGECTEVTLQKDGGWIPLIQKKEQKEQQVEKRKTEVAVVETLSDDSDDSEEATKGDNDDAVIEEVRSKRKQADVEIITLSDSDDESAGPPTKRSNCQSNNSSGSVSSTNNSVDMTVNVTSNLTSNVSGTSGGSSNCGRAETASPDNSNVPASECTISNDSWRVGEVDPGKRLIFRKSLSSSSSNNGGHSSTPNNNGVPNSTTNSSRSASPQIICLDSPVSSPAHSPRAAAQDESSQPGVGGAVEASTVPSTTPVLSPTPSSTPSSSATSVAPAATSPYPISSPASVAASLASLGSELKPISSSSSSSIPLSSPPIPVTITPVPNSSLSPTERISPAGSSGNAYNMDPLSTSNYNIGSLSSPSNLGHPYNIQNLFNPLSMISGVPPTSNADMNFRPQDRYM